MRAWATSNVRGTPCAADVLDGGETTRQKREEAIPLCYELRSPPGIVRHNADFFGDGVSQGVYCHVSESVETCLLRLVRRRCSHTPV
jgi:hypothetical protein